MATNDERREAATLCRRAGEKGVSFNAGTIFEILKVRFSFSSACWSALADLIDPDNIPDNADETDSPLSEPEIDRERLLAIATLMAADSVRSVKKGSSVSPVYILHAARNIAEACGETFGSIRDQELAKWGTSIVPKETIVDRDALLALADDIDKQTDGSMFDALLEDGHYIARRIREAVGA